MKSFRTGSIALGSLWFFATAACGDTTESDSAHSAKSGTGGASSGGLAAAGGTTGGAGFGGAVQLSSVVSNALDHCALSPTGNPEITDMAIPEELTGSLWGVLDSICQGGGFDLSLCAGSTAKLTSISIDQTPYTARVVTVGDQTCCVYKTVGDRDTYSAFCGPVSPAAAAMSRCQIIPNPDDPQQTIEQVTVPSAPSQDSLWVTRDAVCSEGGYDLSSCAGNQATLVTVLEDTFIVGNPEPYKAWILATANTLCCIWETDGAATPAMRARPC